MPHDFPESDWKRLRDLREIALERFCDRTLRQIMQAAMAEAKTAHERYGSVYGLIHHRDKELARAFDDPRRSAAMLQLLAIVSLDLLTPDELATFTPATRQALSKLRSLRL